MIEQVLVVLLVDVPKTGRNYQSVKPYLDKYVPMTFNASFEECWGGGCGKAVGKVFRCITASI